MHPKLVNLLRHIHSTYNVDMLTPVILYDGGFLYDSSPQIIHSIYFFKGTEDDFIKEWASDARYVKLYSASIVEGVSLISKDRIIKISAVYLQYINYLFYNIDKVGDMLNAARDIFFDEDEEHLYEEEEPSFMFNKVIAGDIVKDVNMLGAVVNSYFNSFDFDKHVERGESKTFHLNSKGEYIPIL